MNEIQGCARSFSVRITQMVRSKGVITSLASHHYRRTRKITSSFYMEMNVKTEATAALFSEKDLQKCIK